MGEAEARLFATEGAKVIVADILGSDAEQVAADIRAGGGEASAAKIDVISEAEWRDLFMGCCRDEQIPRLRCASLGMTEKMGTEVASVGRRRRGSW